MKEDAFGTDRDAVRGREVADGKRLHSLYPVDVRLGVNRTEPGAGLVAESQCSGHRWPARLVSGGAEHVVEQKGADATVYTPMPPAAVPTEAPPAESAPSPDGPTTAPSVFTPNESGGPSVAIATYDPKTGRYATPDGKVYRQTDLVPHTGDATWKDLFTT